MNSNSVIQNVQEFVFQKVFSSVELLVYDFWLEHSTSNSLKNIIFIEMFIILKQNISSNSNSFKSLLTETSFAHLYSFLGVANVARVGDDRKGTHREETNTRFERNTVCSVQIWYWFPLCIPFSS